MTRKADQVTDKQYGRPIPNVQVWVFDNSGQLATITADGGGSLSNPFNADAFGNYAFNAPDGVYRVEYRTAFKLIYAEQIIIGIPPAFAGPAGDGVSTYSSLAGVVASDGDASLLTEGLRGGTFVFHTGDYAAQIALDPRQGIYIASTSGVVGAWIRQCDMIEPQYFGALGDGTTDDAAAIQACLNAPSGKRILFPKANYKIGTSLKVLSQVNIDFEPGATLLLATQNMNGIEIGDGSDAVRSATFGTIINRPSFSPFPGVLAFTTGACIYRNNVAICHVNDLSVYGRDGSTTKLWDGVYDYKATQCDTTRPLINWILNNGIHCKGDGTGTGRTVDCNYDFARTFNINKGIFIDAGCAGLGFYRPEVEGVANGGNGLHINCTAGPNGQNFFIDTPDFEVQAGAHSAIWLQSGSDARIKGGWIGASMGFGLKIDAGFDTANVDCAFVQSRIVIAGPHNTISGGTIDGDSITAADGIQITGANTVIASGVKVRQWAAYGISWGGTAPANVLIGALAYANNGTDIAPLSGFSAATMPVILPGSTDKVRTATAAASLALPLVVPFAQVTGATPITTIPVRGVGARITLQAGAGGISFASGGNLTLPASPLAIAAFNTVSFVTDGATWFFDGKSA